MSEIYPEKSVIPIPRFDDDVREGIFHSESTKDVNQPWEDLGTTNAAFARDAIVRAQQLRESGTDPGQAYLAGIADFQSAIVGQAILEAASSVDIDKELDDLTDKL